MKGTPIRGGILKNKNDKRCKLALTSLIRLFI